MRQFARVTKVLQAALVILVAHATLAAAAEPEPWWQLEVGSRPSNLWISKNQVQELQREPGMTLILNEGSVVVCMGDPNCTTFFGLPNSETPGQVQTALEAVYGAGNVEVTEGTGPGHPFVITNIGSLAGKPATPVEAFWLENPEKEILRVVTVPGSGRIAVTLTNLGDAAVDGTVTPVEITDKLPSGIEADEVEGFAGFKGQRGTVECHVASGGEEVTCTYAGTLPPYEAIELEIYVHLVGESPTVYGDGTVLVSGGGAAAVEGRQHIRVSPDKVAFGLQSYMAKAEAEGGAEVTQAASHPFQFTTSLQFNQGAISPGKRNPETSVEQPGQPRNVTVELPAGLVGDATQVSRCSGEAFLTRLEISNDCPAKAAIGAASVTIVEPQAVGFTRLAVPIFNLQPKQGEPARFGFLVAGVPVTLVPTVGPGTGYRVVVQSRDNSQVAALLATTVTLWGEPADPRHDNARGWDCLLAQPQGPCLSSSALGLTQEAPFLRLPTSCATPLAVPLALEPWDASIAGGTVEEAAPLDMLDSCNRVPFDPELEIAPGTHDAEAPSGLSVHLKVPQEASEAPEGIAESDVRDTKVSLPPGLHINPAAANGLQACSEAQIGFSHMDGDEAVFDEEPTTCPDASKLGKVRIASPLLEEPVTGWVYQAAQEANPFHSLIALYVDAEAPEAGVHVKLAGKVEIDKQTGQVVSSFDETPQLPFEDFELTIFGGSGAPLATSSCGTYKTETQIGPWSGNPPATPSSEFRVSGCPSAQPFRPSFTAGTESALAGTYSPFLLRLTREDGSQQLSAIDTTLPPGMTGKLAGIPYCPESAISRAEGLDKPGDGAVEQSSPSCPAASQVGTVRVGSGIGPSPLFVKGNAYLAGPYKGAPLSLEIITPAVAGPFDLGTVAVRTSLYVDPLTTRITAKSDPLPTALQGIPLALRSVALKMDRPSFTLNPTSCERMSVSGTALSTLGQGAVLTNPFQVGGCGGLGFKPKLKISLKGSTKHAGHPALKAVLTYPKGGAYANIARAQVNLPASEFIEQNNLNKTCTKPVLLEGKCPRTTIYGKAKAWTPLLEKPIQGNVYLVGGFGYKLPALVAELNGQIRVLLKGKVDSGPNKGIRNTFEAVPDAPVERFVLEMKGGPKYSLLINSENLCKKPQRAIARFTAQNGKVLQMKPVIGNDCNKKGKGKKSKK